MAEDDATANDLTTTDDGDFSRPQTAPARGTRPKSGTPRTKCRSRIDQLAVPNRRLILALYQNHSDHLPRNKVENIKVLLQELYAMTPEETEKYFAHLRKKAREAERRKDIKYMLRRLLKKRKKARQTRQAYEFVKQLLAKGMEYAAQAPIPPLVSIRLRNLSDIILEQLCDLKNVNVPKRDTTDPIEFFLLQVADWMAISIEHLYYEAQLKKNRELEKIERETKSDAARPVVYEGPAEHDAAAAAAAADDDDEEAAESDAVLVFEME